MGNLYSEEEMFDFDDHSSDGDTISSATENNLIEEKVLPTISSTKNRKKWILKKKTEKKIPTNSKQKIYRI